MDIYEEPTVAFPWLIFSLFDSFTFKSNLGFPIMERCGIRKNGWNDNDSTGISKADFVIFANDSKQSITDVIRAIVYFEYFEQFFATVVYADDSTFSCSYETDGRNSVGKSNCIFFLFDNSFSLQVFISDMLSGITLYYSLGSSLLKKENW